MTDSIKLGSRIRAARKAAGFKTAKFFVEKYNIPASTYSQHESGVRVPSDETLQHYSNLFLVNFEWLKSGKGEPFVHGTREEKHKSRAILQDHLPLDLNLKKENSSSKKALLNEPLLALILEKLLAMSLQLEKSLSASEIANMTSGIYGDISQEECSFDIQSKIVVSAVNTYKRAIKMNKKI